METAVYGNVFQRLQRARCTLQKMKIKESGNNTFAKYTYMEIGDFIGKINDIFQAEGLCGYISYGADLATLTIVNMDKPEETILFTTPMSTAELKGCHQVQNHGAVMTYLRRYLWVTALEITEHDALDSTQGKLDSKKELDVKIVKSISNATTVDELTEIYKKLSADDQKQYMQMLGARKAVLVEVANAHG